jgi:hypothetical protein
MTKRRGHGTDDRQGKHRRRLSPVWILDVGMLCCAGAIVAVVLTSLH